MSSVTLNSIRLGMKTNLEAISGLRVREYIPDSVTAPMAVIGFPAIQYDTTMARGCDRYEIPVRLFIQSSSERDGQKDLDGYMGNGSNSVKAAIESDKTLGGIIQTLRVTNAKQAGIYEVNGTRYLGAEFTVELYG